MSRSDMVRNGKTSQTSLLSCLLPSFSYASPAIGRIIILSATSNLAHTFNLVMFWSSALSLALLKCMNVSNVRPILQLPFLVDLYQIMPKRRRSLQGDLNWLVQQVYSAPRFAIGSMVHTIVTRSFPYNSSRRLLFYARICTSRTQQRPGW